eukprot:15311257-Heterocapsa_arctica.AAC.1
MEKAGPPLADRPEGCQPGVDPPREGEARGDALLGARGARCRWKCCSRVWSQSPRWAATMGRYCRAGGE